jgi:hypothetical protein
MRTRRRRDKIEENICFRFRYLKTPEPTLIEDLRILKCVQQSSREIKTILGFRKEAGAPMF